MPQPKRHRQHQLYFAMIKPRSCRPFKPIDEIVAHPQMAIEFIIEQHLTGIAFKPHCRNHAIESRAMNAAIFAEKLPVQPIDIATAFTTASVHRNERQAHQAL